MLPIFIIATAALRVWLTFKPVLDPLSNLTPVGAMALFGGVYFSDPKKAYGFPLMTLFIGDIILSFTVFRQFRSGLLYSGWYWTYAAFALMTLTGRICVREVSMKNILLATLACTMIHWIVSDIGAWQMGILYPKTFGGYLQCLAAAIPYESRFLSGTLLYSGVLFGLFALYLPKGKNIAASL